MEIALVLDLSGDNSRAVASRFADYAHMRPRCTVRLFTPAMQGRNLPSLLSETDAVVYEAHNDALHESVVAAGVPSVGVFCHASRPEVPIVTEDEEPLARQAVEVLLALGLDRLAFRDIHLRTPRGEAFAAAAEAASVACHLSPVTALDTAHVNSAFRVACGQWLRDLPKPIGLACHNVSTARVLCQVAARAGVRIPDEVAVLAIGHDGLQCSLAGPALSCLHTGAEQMGDEAIKLMERLLDGEGLGGHRVMVPPRGVVHRSSTRVRFAEDDVVTAAMRYMLEHLADDIGVEDVAAYLELSRRSLEYRFARHHCRTVHEELMLLRLQGARQLLEQTDLPLADICIRSGFSYPSALCKAFKKRLGVTPGAIRERAREAVTVRIQRPEP
jgi:LacI family transcriptional regulator